MPGCAFYDNHIPPCPASEGVLKYRTTPPAILLATPDNHPISASCYYFLVRQSTDYLAAFLLKHIPIHVKYLLGNPDLEVEDLLDLRR